jgi:hypothetical protein
LSSQGIGATATSSNTNKPDIARRFAQLYSYVIHRYIKSNNILNENQKQHLASVIIEIEEKCITRLLSLSRSQGSLRRAIERNDLTALSDEHDKLLGDETSTGQLPSKLEFDYGTTANSSIRTAPIPLPDKPQKPAAGN